MEQYYLDDANILRPHTPDAQRLAFDAYIAQVIAQFNDAEKTLAGLDTAVASLPKAHQEVAQSICIPTPNIETLKNLIGEVERLAHSINRSNRN